MDQTTSIPVQSGLTSTLGPGVALLGLIGLAAIASAAVQGERKQHQALEEVHRFEGRASYDRVGEVVKVAFDGQHELANRELAGLVPHLRNFRKLTALEIHSDRITDPGLIYLNLLPKLEEVVLVGQPGGEGLLDPPERSRPSNRLRIETRLTTIHRPAIAEGTRVAAVLGI